MIVHKKNLFVLFAPLVFLGIGIIGFFLGKQFYFNSNLRQQSYLDFVQVPVYYNHTTGEIYPVFEKESFGMNCLWSWSGDHGLGDVFTTDATTVPVKEERMGSGMVDVDVICTNLIDGWYKGHYSDFGD